MKKFSLLLAVLPLLLTSCGKNENTFAFEGVVLDYVQCTSYAVTSISEFDFGYIIDITTPDSIGGDYTLNGVTHHNCVILYRTKAQYYQDDSIRGTMYLDDKYSRAYCNFHAGLGLPEGVCYSLER